MFTPCMERTFSYSVQRCCDHGESFSEVEDCHDSSSINIIIYHNQDNYMIDKSEDSLAIKRKSNYMRSMVYNKKKHDCAAQYYLKSHILTVMLEASFSNYFLVCFFCFVLCLFFFFSALRKDSN